MRKQENDTSSSVSSVMQEIALHIQAGYPLLGRILDGLGRPIDDKPAVWDTVPVEIDRDAPPALSRNPLTQVFSTGIRAIDGLLTVARGQRIGIMAGSGVGKSVLLGALARNAQSTVNVIALIGERGREVRDFVEKNLGAEGLARSVVVVVKGSRGRPALPKSGPRAQGGLDAGA